MTGPAFADYDNDGDIDIYVVTEAQQDDHQNRLFENDGQGRFIDVGKLRGVDNFRGFGRGASWGDYDNDGDQDLVVANMGSNAREVEVPTTLYQNLLIETGEPNFREVTRQAGLLRRGNNEDQVHGGMVATAAGVAWADYDNDGYLDLYWKCADYDIDNALFRNNRDGTFTDVTDASGAGITDFVSEANSQGSPNWTDVDHDGNIDLLVTNEGDEKVLLLNDGQGKFRNITHSRESPNGMVFLNPGNANGACVGDIDNDGDQDFYLPMADQANRLFLSNLAQTGEVNFTDTTLQSGADDPGGARGCTMADFDNDGYLDIYVNNGGLSNVLVNDVLKQMPVSVQFYIAWEPAENKLYRNNGDGSFSDVTSGSGATGFGIGSGVAAGDVNDDGFADLFLTNRTYYSMGKRVGIEQDSLLLLNQPNGNHWLRVSLEGTHGPRSPYGARVRVIAGELEQTRELSSAHGYNSADDPRLLFGLGARDMVDRIDVTWPSGQRQSLERVEAGQTVRLVEPQTS